MCKKGQDTVQSELSGVCPIMQTVKSLDENQESFTLVMSNRFGNQRQLAHDVGVYSERQRFDSTRQDET